MIATDAFIAVNKNLIKALGLTGAVLTCELSSMYRYHAQKDLLLPDGWFPATVEFIETQTGLSRDEQQTVFNHLIKLGVVQTAKKGVPAKRHVMINWNLLLDSLTTGQKPPNIQLTEKPLTSQRDSLSLEKPLTSGSKSRQLVNGNYSHSYNNKSNKNNITTTAEEDKSNTTKQNVVDGTERTLDNLNKILTQEGLKPIISTPKASQAIAILLSMKTELLIKFILQCKSLQSEDDSYNLTFVDAIAFVVSHPEAIARISAGTFPRKEKQKKKADFKRTQGNNYEMYVPPEVLQELQNKED